MTRTHSTGVCARTGRGSRKISQNRYRARKLVSRRSSPLAAVRSSPAFLHMRERGCEETESSHSGQLRSLNPPPKTRAERAFHLVERALLRTLLAGKAPDSTFLQPQSDP